MLKSLPDWQNSIFKPKIDEKSAMTKFARAILKPVKFYIYKTKDNNKVLLGCVKKYDPRLGIKNVKIVLIAIFFFW